MAVRPRGAGAELVYVYVEFARPVDTELGANLSTWTLSERAGQQGAARSTGQPCR